jgi:hypothetical protein
MIKKIVVGTLLVAMIGLLVFGAWNRTQAKSASDSASVSGEHLSQANGALQSGAGQGQAGYQGSRGSDIESQQSAANGQHSGQGGQQSAADGQQSAVGSPQADVTELITLLGAVDSAAADAVVVAIPDQAPIELSGRTLSFAQEQGLTFQPGDNLKLTGFYEDQDFEVQAIENLTTGQSSALREESGRPLWAGGRGRRGG